MYIESVPNRNSPPAILLRESYRDGGKIKKRTIANLSSWPTDIIEGLRTLLKGGKVAAADQETIVVRRALPHGHVAAVLGTLRDIGLDRLLGPAGNRCRDLVIAMIVARLIAPASKLATARMLDPLTAAFSLGETLGLGAVDEDELYVALDWLGERQEAVEKALARKHLRAGMLVLYDVSSSYVEGRCCELAQLGYNRDGKKGKLQIVYGLLCARDGCPVAIEVFEGDTADPRTLATQIDKVKKRFALDHVVLVGDRGMITQARVDYWVRSGLTARSSKARLWIGVGLVWRVKTYFSLRAGCRLDPAIGGEIGEPYRRRDRPGRARLDHGATGAGHPGTRGSRSLADVAVRPARHGGHHVARLSGRAAHRLPQSRSRPRARPQARGPIGRDRKGPRHHRSGGSARPQAAARRGRDCAQGWRRRQPAQLVFVNRSKTKRLAEAEGGGERVEHAGGGELGSRRDQPRHNHRDDEVAAAVAGRPEQTIETDVAQRAEHGRHMPVRQRAAHHDGLLIGRRDLSPLEQRAQAFDNVGRPTGQVGDGALLDLAAVPIALPQQDGRRRVPVGDGFDIHGINVP